MEKKKKAMIAFKKARTVIDRILMAMDSANEKQCFNLMQQNLAAIGLLKSANILMLENHLDIHINNLHKNNPEKKKMQQIRDEVVQIIKTAQNK
jgi:DNA-binding FrmR family transcriptional regulator